MPLNLYRRHQGKCEAGHSLDKRTSEFEERKKGWKKCGCYIFASGALGGKYRRKYTGSTDWAQAKIVAAEWEKAGYWDGEIPAPVSVPVAVPQTSAPTRITIERAVKGF